MKVRVAGAGLAGCVAAERFASAGHSVTVFEKRAHVAGHAYDCHDKSGAMIHQYGPHLFHTNEMEVVEYLSRFTSWLPHEHRILSSVNGKLVPVPINVVTLRELFGLDLDANGMRQYLQSVAIKKDEVRTSEDWLLSTYGPQLTDLLFRHYIRRQWGRELHQLDWSVAARIKPRFSDDCRTFTHSFQAIPKYGYAELCHAMLAHKNICVFLDWPHFRLTDAVQHGLTVYTGPIDEFFGHCFGRLPYRSLDFLHINSSITQKAPTIVYPEEHVSFTRITDWRQIPGNHKHSDTTSILIESPAESGEPMYPVPAAESSALYAKYEELAKSRKDILFAGRLGTYKYYNMDQVVKDTLERVKPWL